MNQGYEAHLFICTNQRVGKECCASKGSEELRKKLKEQAKSKWGKRVRINSAGCLDRCSEGIAAVLYPQNEWFTHLKNSDADVQALMEALQGVFDSES